MDNVYVITREDTTDRSSQIIGVFPAEGLAEIARVVLERRMTDEDKDAGIFFRITAYQLGKLYPVDVALLDAII